MESDMNLTAAADSRPRNMNTFLAIWASQMISILGSGLTSFGLGVYIFNQTHQATPFAITVLFGSLPRVIFAPIAGALVDRWDRRTVMMLADSGDALVILAAAALFLTGRLEIWMIYLASFVGALCNTFQEPAYSASVIMLVPKDQLGRANGLIQASQSVELLLSPILAGALFAVIGLGGIFLIDFATYLVAVGALLLLRIPRPAVSQPSGKGLRAFLADAVFGWNYLAARPGLFGLLWYFALVNFFLNMSAVLVAPMVLTTSTSVTLGAVQMVSGIGMLVGSIVVSAWGGPKQRIRGVLTFIALAGAGMLVMGLRPAPVLIGAGFFTLMFAIPFASASSQAIFQVKTAPEVQGRVFSIRSMISRSIMPIAFLVSGPLADRIFEPLMRTGGALANGPAAALLGSGPGRGMGLIFVLSGLMLLAATGAVTTYPRIRNVEKELPDIVADQNE